MGILMTLLQQKNTRASGSVSRDAMLCYVSSSTFSKVLFVCVDSTVFGECMMKV